MTIRLTRFSLRHIALAAVCLAGFAGSAQAATTWTENFGTCANSSKVSEFGNFSAWDPCGSGTSSNVRVGAFATTGTGFISGQVWSWNTGGLGVINSDETDTTGPHAIDSHNGIDSIVLNFANLASLSSLTLGWNGYDHSTATGDVTYGDSDLSVYAWTGSFAGPSTYLTSDSGWTLIGNYGNVGKTADNTQALATSVVSSYWLISALGGSSGSSCGSTARNDSTHDKCVDAFKLLSVAGTTFTPPPTGVPEPGSLALLGLGALGLVAARRKSAARR